MSEDKATVREIHQTLKRLGGFHSVYVHEFTSNDLRIDGSLSWLYTYIEVIEREFPRLAFANTGA